MPGVAVRGALEEEAEEITGVLSLLTDLSPVPSLSMNTRTCGAAGACSASLSPLDDEEVELRYAMCKTASIPLIKLK